MAAVFNITPPYECFGAVRSTAFSMIFTGAESNAKDATCGVDSVEDLYPEPPNATAILQKMNTFPCFLKEAYM